jgi:tRNA-(ms[2]io[6]A)-hydroxylase
MLRLKKESRKDWIGQAMTHIDEILLDHAHCEKKAASMALNLMFRYPEYPQLMQPLSELAREELRHFEQVFSVMEERNILFRRQRPSTYAGRLVSIVRKDEPQRMLDLMLCACLIEARSCERMKILSENLTDFKLARLYKGLLACEARHHQVYIDMLETIFERDEITVRLEEISTHESEVLDTPDDFVRLHT